MVYGRQVGGRELTLEASGALLEGSLVMRDRETDSWWSLMSSSAIGGRLDGTHLEQLPIGEKTLWKEWRTAHPDTRVLSINGREHILRNSYEDYFASKSTFRGIRPGDERLEAKDPVFAFRLGGQSWAVPHSAIGAGRVFEAGSERVLLHRSVDDGVIGSTDAYRVDPGAPTPTGDLGRLVESGGAGKLERLPGFDTYWYTWIAVNPDTKLLD